MRSSGWNAERLKPSRLSVWTTPACLAVLQCSILEIYADNSFLAVDDAKFSKLGNPKIGTTFELNDFRGRIVGIAKVASNGLNGVPTLYTTYNRAITDIPFDGGKRRAVTEQSRVIYPGTVASYRQTALGAFQDVEDNLSTIRILSQEYQAQNGAVISSQRYLDLANVCFKSGVDS